MNRPPDVLILTASFGDGHNAAARALAAGFGRIAGAGVRVGIHDLVCEAEPVKGPWLQRGYKFAITHWPWAWRQIYHAAELVRLEDDRLFFLDRVQRRLASLVDDVRPEAIVCTFPLYPHLLARLFGASGPAVPVVTVVTDSITIHQLWLCTATSFYLSPDHSSSAELRRRGVAPERIYTSGFPVDPEFAEVMPPASAPDPLRRVLYFPATRLRHVRRALDSLLGEGPRDLEITVVFGRHEDRLRRLAVEIEQRHPHRKIAWLGWTNEVPALLHSHHCVIGKAGGATTHECAAAGRPLLITQIVPGQEEGNAELVQRRGSGCHVSHPEALGPLLTRLQGSPQWKKMCAAAAAHRRPQAALDAARFVLARLAERRELQV